MMQPMQLKERMHGYRGDAYSSNCPYILINGINMNNTNILINNKYFFSSINNLPLIIF